MKVMISHTIVYAFSLVVVASVMLSNAVSALLGGSAGPSVYGTSYCYLSQNLTCSHVYINRSSQTATLVVEDSSGSAVRFPAGSFTITLPGSQTRYGGACQPYLISSGSEEECTAAIGAQDIGSKQLPGVTFSVVYQVCQKGVCGQDSTASDTVTLNAT